MNAYTHLRYTLWPRVKVRGTYALLALRYGGVRKIPPEVVAQQMQKSVERMEQNLKNALRALPDDVDEEERRLLLTAIGQSEKLKAHAEQLGSER